MTYQEVMKRVGQKIGRGIGEHSFIIVLAVLLTLLVEGPLLVFPWLAGDRYQGINIAHFGSDEHFYLTRGKEVADGNALGNPILREGKNAPDYYFMITERLLVAPLRVLGITQHVDIVAIYNIANALGVFALIMLIYAFCLKLAPGNKLLAASAALFVIGGYSLVYNKSFFYTDFNIYGRAMFPYVSSIFFFLFLIVLVQSVTTQTKWQVAAAGLLFGFLFYIYFYAWTFSLALLAAWWLITLARRDFTRCKQMSFIISVGLLAGGFHLWRIFSFVTSPVGNQFAYFSWAQFGHSPVMSKISLVLLILYGVYVYRIKDTTSAASQWVFASAFAGWIAVNQQVITGKVLQYGHYYWFFIVPVSIVGGFYLLWFVLKNKHVQIIFCVLAIICVFVNTAVGQFRSFFTTFPHKLHEQNYRPALRYLQSQVQQPTVVLATEHAASFLATIYTPHDLFWDSGALMNGVPLERVKTTLAVYLYLNKNVQKKPADFLWKIMEDPAHQSLYKNLYQALEGFYSGYDYYTYTDTIANDVSRIRPLRTRLIKELAEEYTTFAQSAPAVQKFLEQYGVTYILWDSQLSPEWDLTVLPHKVEVLHYNQIHLYKLNTNTTN